MRISPNADPDDSFFIDIKMENQERDEYIHIEECMYTERDDYGEQVGDSILLIEDGCDLSGGLIQFKGYYIIRVLFFYLTRTGAGHNL